MNTPLRRHVCIVNTIVDFDIPGKVWDFMTASMLRDCLTYQALLYTEVFHLSFCLSVNKLEHDMRRSVNTVKFSVTVMSDLNLRRLDYFFAQ